MTQITIRRPDDFHLHLRDGEELADALIHTARVFMRGLVMPNLNPPVRTLESARVYRERILRALPEGVSFEPLMSLYLTDRTTPEDISKAAESGIVHAAKLYPAGATTNSESGVTDLGGMDEVFGRMSEIGMPLAIHGEVIDPSVDFFDRERVFVEAVLPGLTERHPELKIVLEHASTKEAIDFVRNARPGIASTLTAHHLLLTRNDIFTGGLNPHHFCLPVLKSAEDRRALVEAAVSGDPRFFAGTDSAPHTRRNKERTGGAGGIFSAPVAVEIYAEIFFAAGAIEKLGGFLSVNGALFYGLPPNEEKLVLERTPRPVPEELPFGGGTVVSLRAGNQVQWTVVEGTRQS